MHLCIKKSFLLNHAYDNVTFLQFAINLQKLDKFISTNLKIISIISPYPSMVRNDNDIAVNVTMSARLV